MIKHVLIYLKNSLIEIKKQGESYILYDSSENHIRYDSSLFYGERKINKKEVKETINLYKEEQKKIDHIKIIYS